MTEETRKQLEIISYCKWHGWQSMPEYFCDGCFMCNKLLTICMSAYELGEKAGRSAQKAEDNSYGNGTCSGVDLVG
jgi:hypothetical protein